ncbi:MAG: DUF2726 domain-containing protein [Gemmataceae bacterium]|nr:DUF2726 domain-containing protein [Gemmataceae bacterium]
MKSRFRKRTPRNARPRQVHFRPRHFLLTRNEAAFLRVLLMLVGHRYLISCKVRLADIITCSDADWKRGHANRIAQKHVDFVVSCAQSSRIVAAGNDLKKRASFDRQRRAIRRLLLPSYLSSAHFQNRFLHCLLRLRNRLRAFSRFAAVLVRGPLSHIMRLIDAQSVVPRS